MKDYNISNHLCDKRKLLFVVFLVFTILWMALIFGMSSQNGDESGGLSEKVTRVICKVVISNYENLSQTEQDLYISKLNYPVRKCAHMSEYCVLFMLMYGTVFYLTAKKRLRRIFPFAFTVLYAATDEIHQLFVGGRAGAFLDVLIDSSGALLGLLIIIIVGRIKK